MSLSLIRTTAFAPGLELGVAAEKNKYDIKHPIQGLGVNEIIYRLSQGKALHGCTLSFMICPEKRSWEYAAKCVCGAKGKGRHEWKGKR